MTKIKLCGLTRLCDIEAANELLPEYIGFVFAPGSRRYVTPERAAELKKALCPNITAVGVFVDEEPEVIAELLERGVIGAAQLHGGEDEEYIRRLRALTGKPIIKAFRMDGEEDAAAAERSGADLVLLDSGSGGTGKAFDWRLAEKMGRLYFLSGGLSPENAGAAVRRLHPYGVDVSSGIETGGHKDIGRMRRFVEAVRTTETMTECEDERK